MSSLFGTPSRGCTRESHGPSRRWLLTLLLWTGAASQACGFEPPGTVPIPVEFLDALPRADGGPRDGGAPPDGEGPGDLSLADMGPTDADTRDLGRPDLPPPEDAGVPADADPADAGPPPSDAQVDAGAPDADPVDTGVPVDAGCGLALPNSPAVVTTYSVPHDIDAPALLFDADGDGDEEIIVASVAQRTLSVIEVDGCGRAQVFTENNVRMNRDGPAGVYIAGLPAILTAGNGDVRGYRYDPARTPAISTSNNLRVQNVGTLDFITGDPPGESFMVAGLESGGDPAYSAFDSALTRTESDLGARLNGRAAFLGPYGAGLASYLGASDRGLEALLPGQSEILLDSGSGLVGESDVSTFRVGTVPVSGRALGVYASRTGANTRDIRFVLVNPQSPAGPDRGSIGLMAALFSGPALATRPRTVLPDDLIIYFVRGPNHLNGCTVENIQSSVLPMSCSTFLGVGSGVNLGVGNAHASIEPVTGYVNNDDNPDVIMALRDGHMMFLQHNLSQLAASTVDLIRDIAGTPGMSVAFYDRLQLSGSALVVPHLDGTISLIGWATPNNAGSAGRLWFQHRRDAARSGSL